MQQHHYLKNAFVLMVKRRNESSRDHITTYSCSQKVSTELVTYKTKIGEQFLTVDNISHTESSVIAYAQRQCFPVEIATLEALIYSNELKIVLHSI